MNNGFTQVWYHSNCNDGITAASLALKAFPNAKAVPVKYGQPPPDYTSADKILIVDFSYPRQALLGIAEGCEKVVVLDHHLTAQKELEGIQHPRLTVVFDMNKCGAMLTFEFLSLFNRVPHGLELVQDRDLWTKKWPIETEAFFMGMGLLEQEPGDKWYHAVMENWQAVINQGHLLVAFKNNQIKSLIRNRIVGPGDSATQLLSVKLNSPVFQSDLGERLLAEVPEADYADIYYVNEKGRTIHSLRSRNGSDIDVSAIAKSFGGGGHKHASGYTS